MEYLLGTGALVERWSLTANFFDKRRKLVARWNQLDVSNPRRPLLTCPLEEINESS